MRHVAPEQRAHLVGDLAELPRLDGARIGRAATEDHLGTMLLREREHLVVVDHARLARDPVVDDRVEAPGEVDLETVGEVAAVIEAQRQHRVSRLHQPEIDGHVRLRARVGLDVGVLGPEERLRAVDRELLDLVDDLAASVVALAGIPLGVLVGRHRADGLEDRRPGEVLRRDQLDLVALPLELVAEERRDVGIDLGKPGRAQPVEGVDGVCHGVTDATATRLRPRSKDATRLPGALRVSPRQPRSGQAPSPGCPAPARRITGSAAVTSITVDGVPGSSPPSTTAATPARISGGTSASVRGSGPPGRFALVATTAPMPSTTSAADARERRNPQAERPGLALGQPREATAPGSGRRACTAPAGAPARSRAREHRARGGSGAARRRAATRTAVGWIAARPLSR